MNLSLSACVVNGSKRVTRSTTKLCQPKKMLLAVAISAALTPLTMTQAAQKEPVQAQQTQQLQFTIASGPLEQVLTAFGQQAGIILIFSTELTRGINSQGLQGSYSIEQGFAALLKTTDFMINKTAEGYILKEKETGNRGNIGTLATAIVESDDIKDGSSEDGYISDGNTSVGIWQGRKLQDTPYSINVISEDLLQNLQATSTDQVFKMSPVAQLSWPQAQNDSPYINARGFRIFTSSRNGIARDIYDHGVNMEEVARVEVLTGMSGFLYGPGNIGGMVNYVTKRPTEERLNSVSMGNTSGSNLYAHGDFSGRLDDKGDFGYRLNLVTQAGETAVKYQELKRNLASLALDWQVTETLLLQLDGSYRDYRLNGRQAYWNTWGSGDGLVYPDAKTIDSDKLWTQKWNYQATKNKRIGANLQWLIGENMTLRAGYLEEKILRHGTLSLNTINDDGTYDQSSSSHKNAPHEINGRSLFSYFDVDFATGGTKHKITTGIRVSDNDEARYRDSSSQDHDITAIDLSNPSYTTEPTWDTHGKEGLYVRNRWGTDNISIGDDITFNEYWSALIGISHSRIYTKSYNKKNEIRNEYDESAVTPSVSLIYKPLDSVTTYASYMEGLEGGGVAKVEPKVINAGEVLKPLISTQYELGAKVNVNGMLLTAAVFEIDKALEYYANINETQVKLVQDGRQIHRGLEFTATGNATDNLTIVGGLTLLDAQTQKTNDIALEGKRPRNVAEKMFKLYGEYSITDIPGLVVNGGFSHTGDFYTSNKNEYKLDGYTLFDIGARYQLNIAEKPVTLRVNISNLTDKRYWANYVYLGDGRRVSLSANVEF
jgi:iron complex outermembrane receptor protein